MKKLVALVLILALPVMPAYATTISPIETMQKFYYSDNELNQAKKRIAENKEKLSIISISTSSKDNSLIVTASDWDENKKMM